MILPDNWKLSSVGENIVIAWNASREAARAVHDAMPLLVKAKKVTIFTFSARESALQATSEMLADQLNRHGVVAERRQRSPLAAPGALADRHPAARFLATAGELRASRCQPVWT